MQQKSDRHELAIDLLSGRTRLALLLLVSILGLFLEICLIRWHGSEFRVVSFFKNVTLLACFLGLGLGFAATKRCRNLFPFFPVLLLIHVVCLSLLRWAGVDSRLRLPQSSSGLWLWGVKTVSNVEGSNAALETAGFYAFFLFLFVITIVVFVPLGQLTGRLMQGVPPLKAYTFNVLGSVGGVLLFTAASYLWLPPVIWFGLVVIMTLFCFAPDPRMLRWAAPLGLALLMLMAIDWDTTRTLSPLRMQHIYSPYQHIELQPFHVVGGDGVRLHRGMAAFANKSYHLRATDLSRSWIGAHGEQFPWAKEEATAYDLPYQFAPDPQSILIIGSGAGNDVAAALRNSPSQARIDAVEIDPALHLVGVRHHPERPYQDARVTVEVEDARQFIKRTDRRYDMIVFGLVDSHTLLSTMSSVRLDNFVYTREAFEEAKKLLTPRGLIAISFSTPPMDHVGLRIYSMLKSVFPEAPPRAFRIGFDHGVLYVAGASLNAVALPREVAQTEVTQGYEDPAVAFPPETSDDWPFLYMSTREVPRSYVGLIILLAAASVVGIFIAFGRGKKLNLHFFFLGSAFMLVEAKGVTELALVWGTTWVVNSVVVVSILLAVLAATLFTALIKPRKVELFYAILLLTLLLAYFLPVDFFLGMGWHHAAIGSAAMLFLPLFFAGIVFAISLQKCESVPDAFASNLLGAILGGFCEYASMAVGFRALTAAAILLYAFSWLTISSVGPPGRLETT